MHPLGPGRSLNNARLVDPLINFDVIKKHLDVCSKVHRDACRPFRSRELSTTKMIDVLSRKVVPYPPDCEYMAPSYVWGRVHPQDGALESGTLPATIEDAITATKKLGMRYLWVDALCIDQSTKPTPEQAIAKQAQLKIMDRIYAGAALVFIAVSGRDSNAGLPGLSMRYPRAGQVSEHVGDVTLFTVPPSVNLSIASSTWHTRAWTL